MSNNGNTNHKDLTSTGRPRKFSKESHEALHSLVEERFRLIHYYLDAEWWMELPGLLRSLEQVFKVAAEVGRQQWKHELAKED